MENKSINNNGHPYVDLCLPSGTLWATCNIGASKSSDYGLYFQWGDTQGYTKEQVGKEKQFNWANYKWSIDGSSSNFSKYTTIGATLDLEDDAAHVHMGGDWHIPTDVQICELLSNTTKKWTELVDVSGMKFTSKKNGNSIFIPAVGTAWDGSVEGSGECGYIRSSMLSVQNIFCNSFFTFYSESAYRANGFPVRGVIG